MIRFEEHGKGLGYYVTLIGPLIYLGVGFIAVLTAKWWIAYIPVSALILIIVTKIAVEPIIIILLYILISCIFGINIRFMKRIHKR